jgi:hypothetical protein
MATDAGVQRALKSAVNALPRTEDGIAGFLGRLGVKGKLSCEKKCVLANYFAAAVNKPHVVVDGNRVEVFADKNHDKELATAKLPNAAGEFISNFDHGEYPFLKGSMTKDAVNKMADEGLVTDEEDYTDV